MSGFGVFGGIVFWLVHLLGSAAIVPLSCEAGSTLGLHALTAITALLTVASGLESLRILSSTTGPRPRARFVGMLGLGIAGISLFLILLEGAANVGLGPC